MVRRLPLYLQPKNRQRVQLLWGASYFSGDRQSDTAAAAAAVATSSVFKGVVDCCHDAISVLVQTSIQVHEGPTSRRACQNLRSKQVRPLLGRLFFLRVHWRIFGTAAWITSATIPPTLLKSSCAHLHALAASAVQCR